MKVKSVVIFSGIMWNLAIYQNKPKRI